MRLHILHHAAQGPIYGVWMAEELAHHGYRISPGTLYPLLHGLEKKGYLKAKEKRIGKTLDPGTHKMPAELDVANPAGALSSGMYPTVKWPIRSTGEMLTVPATAVVTNTERSFVVRVRDGKGSGWTSARAPSSAIR
jgi:hypothetical protein